MSNKAKEFLMSGLCSLKFSFSSIGLGRDVVCCADACILKVADSQ